MSILNPFSWMSNNSSDLSARLGNIYRYECTLLPGFKKSQYVRDLTTLFGKKGSRTVSQIDGFLDILERVVYLHHTGLVVKDGPSIPEKVDDTLAMLYQAHEGSLVFNRHTATILGIAPIHNLIIKGSDSGAYQYNKLFGSIGVHAVSLGEDIESTYRNLLSTAMWRYAQMTKDRSIYPSKLQDKCQQCGASFTSQWIDEDGDHRDPVAIYGECCDNCGIHIPEAKIKDYTKAIDLIRKFEDESGKKILPRVA